VTHTEHTDLALDRLELLEGGKDEDGGLTHTRLGLAEDVHTENGLRNTLRLDCEKKVIGQKLLVLVRSEDLDINLTGTNAKTGSFRQGKISLFS